MLKSCLNMTICKHENSCCNCISDNERSSKAKLDIYSFPKSEDTTALLSWHTKYQVLHCANDSVVSTICSRCKTLVTSIAAKETFEYKNANDACCMKKKNYWTCFDSETRKHFAFWIKWQIRQFYCFACSNVFSKRIRLRTPLHSYPPVRHKFYNASKLLFLPHCLHKISYLSLKYIYIFLLFLLSNLPVNTSLQTYNGSTAKRGIAGHNSDTLYTYNYHSSTRFGNLFSSESNFALHPKQLSSVAVNITNSSEIECVKLNYCSKELFCDVICVPSEIEPVLCQQDDKCLHMADQSDSNATQYYEEFENVLNHYAYQTTYSVRGGKLHCLEMYKSWICAKLLNISGIIKLTPNKMQLLHSLLCPSVEASCPFFRIYNDTKLQGGLPAFICQGYGDREKIVTSNTCLNQSQSSEESSADVHLPNCGDMITALTFSHILSTVFVFICVFVGLTA